MLGNVVRRFDLDRADSRVDALREAAKLVTSIRDRAKVEAFTRELAGMVGVEIDQARAEVRRASNRRTDDGGRTHPQRVQGAVPTSQTRPSETRQGPPMPNPRDPRFALERDVLKLTFQYPVVILPLLGELTEGDFTHPAYASLWRLVASHGAPAQGESFLDVTRDALSDEGASTELSGVLNALAVEPLPLGREPDRAYANAHVFRLREATTGREIADLRSKLQRTDPAAQEDYQRVFAALVSLENQRRALRERALGGAQ